MREQNGKIIENLKRKGINMLRKKIFNIIEIADNDNTASKCYDIILIISILASLFPLAFKQTYIAFNIIDTLTATIFIIDYILRFVTADYKLKRNNVSAFFIYPITPLALIDLASILPSLSIATNGLKMLRMLRLFRTLKALRAFKFIRYSRNVAIIINVFKKQKQALICVGTLSIAYILISALIIFNVEPESFENFFDAIYWATVSLTTMGYGDIYPITTFGRIVTMFSSIFGIAIVALPAGIITAGYMSEINNE